VEVIAEGKGGWKIKVNEKGVKISNKNCWKGFFSLPLDDWEEVLKLWSQISKGREP